MRADARPLCCISLHDVAPATLDECRDVLDFLDTLNAGPVALLVVPDYHGRGRVDRDPAFVSFVDARIRRGDEVVLHGLRHVDSAPLGLGVREWLERRVYTAGEGEFSRLDTATARRALLRGLAILRGAGWHPTGFVAPAWLMSPGTLEALEDLPFRYCSTRSEVVLLDTGTRLPAPSLVVSTRSHGRRMASIAWNAALARVNARRLLVRAALHPSDLRYAGIRRLWRHLLTPLVDARRIVTESQLLPRVRRTPQAPGKLRRTA
jgi:predicted deacetylase